MPPLPQTLIVDDERLARDRLRQLIEEDGRVAIAGERATGREALEAIQELRPDIVFLDIQMPEQSGIDVLAALEPGQVPAVVFVTAYDAYALKAFDLHAVDYLLKPFDRERFQAALQKALDRLALAGQERPEASVREDTLDQRLDSLLQALGRNRQSRPERLSVKEDGRILLVPVEEIDWIGAADNYVEIHANGERHLRRDTLSALEAKLDPERFLRISRSAIVAIDRIREIEPLFHGEYRLVLADGARLAASRRYKDAIRRLAES